MLAPVPESPAPDSERVQWAEKQYTPVAPKTFLRAVLWCRKEQRTKNKTAAKLKSSLEAELWERIVWLLRMEHLLRDCANLLGSLPSQKDQVWAKVTCGTQWLSILNIL